MFLVFAVLLLGPILKTNFNYKKGREENFQGKPFFFVIWYGYEWAKTIIMKIIIVIVTVFTA